MKITQTKDIRASNRWEIMGLVLRHWPISRADICRRTGLNKATVSTIVKEWLDAGLLRETELGRSEGGRKPILLKPREEAGCTVALDLDIRRVNHRFCKKSNRGHESQSYKKNSCAIPPGFSNTGK